MSRPFKTVVLIIPACFPEQFIASEDLGTPLRIASSLACWSSGHSAGICKADSSSPTCKNASDAVEVEGLA